jgi:hypothetical protein
MHHLTSLAMSMTNQWQLQRYRLLRGSSWMRMTTNQHLLNLLQLLHLRLL